MANQVDYFEIGTPDPHDVAASLAKAQELGASVVMPIVDNGQITFAHLVDPTGNRFAIWRRNDEPAG